MNKVIHGDCLIESEQIESGSVDLILTDLPYGTVEAIGNNDSISHGMKGKTAWDIPIEPKDIYSIANRILRKNGKMILFAQEPYTNLLINEAIPNLPFSYRMMWEKDHFANSLIAKKAPVSYYEDILVFSKVCETEAIHPLRRYAEMVHRFVGIEKDEIIKSFDMVKVNFLRYSDTQFAFCPIETYNKFITMYRIDRMIGFKSYEELKEIDYEHKSKYASTFNLWEGNKYKSNILKYAKDYDGYHPTQKPVLLLEDLIKTFSNEGDLVVDLTAGSGSTAIACINTKRRYLVIEKEQKYIDIINRRIMEHESQLTITL